MKTVLYIHRDQQGFTLIEVLVAAFIATLLGVGLVMSSVFALRFQKITEMSNVARNLAVSKMELLAAQPVTSLDNSDDGTESNLTVSGHQMRFNRATDVTVNGDNSRTVVVTVSGNNNPYLPFPISYSTTFAIKE